MSETNVAIQRACLMGLLTAILHDEGEKSLREIKGAIAETVARMIDMNVMVGDFIDFHTVEAAKEFLEQERALDQVKNLLN